MKEKIYRKIVDLGITTIIKVFPEYFSDRPLDETDRYLEIPFAIKNLPKPPAKILDVGCSGSMFPLILRAMGYDVTGIDKRPHESKDRFKFIWEDITRWRSKEEFDCVTCISVLEHIGIGGRYGNKDDDYADYAAMKNMVASLKHGGTLILTVPWRESGGVNRPYNRFYNSDRMMEISLAAGRPRVKLFKEIPKYGIVLITMEKP
jgi:2-polyprenyl-3-methyl-5-hydroxy-6-metoxy-1,4-benzoquinol methylase